MCGGVSVSAGDHFAIRLRTENVWVARKYAFLLKKLFKIEPDISVRMYPRHSRPLSFLVLVLRHEGRGQSPAGGASAEPVWGSGKRGAADPQRSPAAELLQKSLCERGGFWRRGLSADPNRSYHFEIACTGESQAEQLRELIREINIDAKIVKRKKYFVVYVKEGDQIADLLGLMEARKSLLKLENVRILREMRGSVNRKVNCETANINKTVNAAVKQIGRYPLYPGYGRLFRALEWDLTKWPGFGYNIQKRH